MTAANGRDEAALGQPRPNQVRYWPTAIDAPRLPDGTIDIRALCRLYDDAANAGRPAAHRRPSLEEAIEVVREAGYPIPDPWPDEVEDE